MILVTGSEGQVGYALLRALAPLGEVKGLTMPDWRQALQLTVRNAEAPTLADLNQAGDLFD